MPVRRTLAGIEAGAQRAREWLSRFEPGALGAFHRAGSNSQLISGMPFSSSDVVIDAGAYQGGWADEILCRYGSRLILFEPIPEFAGRLRERYGSNNRVEIFESALGSKAGRVQISLQADGSSVYGPSTATSCTVEMVDVAEFLGKRLPDGVTGLKLNIEGGEYDVLERLLDGGWAHKVRVILIQFHQIADDCVARRSRIQSALAKTHVLKFDYPFVWECWVRQL